MRVHVRGQLPLCVQPATVCCPLVVSELDVKFAVVTRGFFCRGIKLLMKILNFCVFGMIGTIQSTTRTTLLKSTKISRRIPVSAFSLFSLTAADFCKKS